MSVHRPRLEGETLLATRRALSRIYHRHENVVRRRCQPIACDVDSRALLYDMDDCEQRLSALMRRVA